MVWVTIRRRLSGEAIGRWIKRAGLRNNTKARATARQLEISESKTARGAEFESKPKQISMTDFAFESGLTPEVHIVQLLKGRRGSLHQQELIAETGWSRSTVSRLLGEMEVRGEIIRVCLGNENVVYLPDSMPSFVQRIEPVPISDR